MTEFERRLIVLEYKVDQLLDFFPDFLLRAKAGLDRIRLAAGPDPGGGGEPEPPHDPNSMRFVVTVWGAGNARAASAAVVITDPAAVVKGIGVTDGLGVADVTFWGVNGTTYSVTASKPGHVPSTRTLTGGSPGPQALTIGMQRDRDAMPETFNFSMVNSANASDKPNDWTCDVQTDTIRKVPNIQAYLGVSGSQYNPGVGWVGDVCIQGYVFSHTAHSPRRLKFILAQRPTPVLSPNQPDLWSAGWAYSSAGGTCAEVGIAQFLRNVSAPAGSTHFTEDPGGYSIDIS